MSKEEEDMEVMSEPESDAESDAASIVTEDEIVDVNLDDVDLDETEEPGSEEDNDDEEGEEKDDDEEKKDDDEDDELDEHYDDVPVRMKSNSLSDDEEEDEEHLQKFDNDIHESIQEKYHPEMKIHNTDEIEASCKVIRDKNGVIMDPLHKTIPFVTSYEKARVIGERAKQINNGAKPFIKVEESLIDGYLIALKEFEEKKIPFIIQRPLPNGLSEYWRLKDLDII